MKRAWLVTTAFVLAITAGACGWDDDVDSRVATQGLPNLTQDLEAHEWVLEGSDPPVTIAFRDDMVFGKAPCNSYRGQVEIGDETSVEIGPLAVTRMACEERVMAAEQEYLDALARVTKAKVNRDNNRLTLEGDGIELHFRSYDADELLVGEWQIVNVASGDAITSVLTGTDPKLTFEEDGNVFVTTGCNGGGSSWSLDGDEIEIDPVRLTRKACDSPDGVMEQEAAIVAALESATRVAITPAELTFLDRDGNIVLKGIRQ